jgi:2-dehydro-3-deoxyglucarate aldolase/4-hydroxy-2-oxoheptanedioate aldolase
VYEGNRLTMMIKNNLVPLGMQCFTGNHALIEVLGHTGFDFVMLDSEHCGINPRAIEDTVRAADCAGLVPIVRIPEAHDGTAIRRALEAGAQGLIIPMVKSAADIRTVADSAMFPPLGRRGICPAVRAAGYSFRSFSEYAAWNNENILLIPLIEHPDAVENIDEICADENVHIITFGAGDLAYALGEGTQMLKGAEVQAAYARVRAAASRHGVAVMGGPVLEPTVEGCQQALKDGVSVFCLGLDVLGFRSFCEDTVRSLNAAVDASDVYHRPPAPASGFPGR